MIWAAGFFASLFDVNKSTGQVSSYLLQLNGEDDSVAL